MGDGRSEFHTGEPSLYPLPSWIFLSHSIGCFSLRAFAYVVLSGWNNLSLDLWVLAVSGSMQISLPHEGSLLPIISGLPIPLSCIALYNTISSHHSSFSACSPLEWKTLDLNSNGIHSVSPRHPDPPLASSAEEMNVPSYVCYFSPHIVWHSRKTAYKNLNPVRKQKDLFGKMKQNIFLSCINIWWMLNKVFSK